MAWVLTGYFDGDETGTIALRPTEAEVLKDNPDATVGVMRLRLRNADEERIERYMAEGFQLEEVFDA